MVSYIRENGTRSFAYNFDLEIVSENTPKTWLNKMF
jgi:hypothetical protein